MGQRLNLQIEMNIPDSSESKVLANAYYHWAGYTSSAFDLVKQIVDSGVYYSYITDPVEKAIRMLEVTGAGLTEDEFTETYPESKYKLSENRNEGLIAISEEGMLETRNWEEARVTINLSTGMVDMGGVFYIDEIDEVDEEVEVVELVNPLEVDITKFQELYEEITNLSTYRIKDSEYVYGLID